MARKRTPELDARMQPSEWMSVIAEKYGIPSIDLSQWDFDPDVLKLLPREFVAARYVFPVNVTVPKDRNQEVIILAMADPGDEAARKEAEFMTSRSAVVVVTTHESIEQAIADHYDGRKRKTAPDDDDPDDPDE